MNLQPTPGFEPGTSPYQHPVYPDGAVELF